MSNIHDIAGTQQPAGIFISFSGFGGVGDWIQERVDPAHTARDDTVSVNAGDENLGDAWPVRMA